MPSQYIIQRFSLKPTLKEMRFVTGTKLFHKYNIVPGTKCYNNPRDTCDNASVSRHMSYDRIVLRGKQGEDVSL